MKRSQLSAETDERVRLLFPPEQREEVRTMLVEECGNNLPFCQELDSSNLDRFQFAALKLSDGDLDKLRVAISLAKRDWRDLLVASGFGNDHTEHRRWKPERKW